MEIIQIDILEHEWMRELTFKYMAKKFPKIKEVVGFYSHLVLDYYHNINVEHKGDDEPLDEGEMINLDELSE